MYSKNKDSLQTGRQIYLKEFMYVAKRRNKYG